MQIKKKNEKMSLGAFFLVLLHINSNITINY